MHTKIEYKLLNIGTVREYFLLLTLSILRLQCYSFAFNIVNCSIFKIGNLRLNS